MRKTNETVVTDITQPSLRLILPKHSPHRSSAQKVQQKIDIHQGQRLRKEWNPRKSESEEAAAAARAKRAPQPGR